MGHTGAVRVARNNTHCPWWKHTSLSCLWLGGDHVRPKVPLLLLYALGRFQQDAVGELRCSTVEEERRICVVDWSISDRLRTELVADALGSACRECRSGRSVIFHSDRGCQYTGQQFASCPGGPYFVLRHPTGVLG